MDKIIKMPEAQEFFNDTIDECIEAEAGKAIEDFIARAKQAPHRSHRVEFTKRTEAILTASFSRAGWRAMRLGEQMWGWVPCKACGGFSGCSDCGGDGVRKR